MIGPYDYPYIKEDNSEIAKIQWWHLNSSPEPISTEMRFKFFSDIWPYPFESGDKW